MSGPIAWRVADFSLSSADVAGRKHTRYEMTLGLRTAEAASLTLTRYEARVSFAGLAESEWSDSVQWSLQRAAEQQITLQVSLPCLETSSPCRAPVGPTWTVVLLGSDQRGRAIREVIELILPPAPGKPVTPPIKVSRAAGASGRAIPIRISSNLVLVPAAVNGFSVLLLLDTGAQVTSLSPDVASRLGIVVPPDAPVFPLAGIGAGSAPIVIVPSLRLGDYVVEKLPVAVVRWHLFAELPIKFDGLLGANVLEFFRMTVDRQAKELRLDPSP